MVFTNLTELLFSIIPLPYCFALALLLVFKSVTKLIEVGKRGKLGLNLHALECFDPSLDNGAQL